MIVDEAHGYTLAGGIGKGRQQRFELLRRIAENPSRHLKTNVESSRHAETGLLELTYGHRN